MFLTSAWSETPTIVDTARLTSFLGVIDGLTGMAMSQTNLCNKRFFPDKLVHTSMRNGVRQ